MNVEKIFLRILIGAISLAASAKALRAEEWPGYPANVMAQKDSYSCGKYLTSKDLGIDTKALSADLKDDTREILEKISQDLFVRICIDKKFDSESATLIRSGFEALIGDLLQTKTYDCMKTVLPEVSQADFVRQFVLEPFQLLHVKVSETGVLIPDENPDAGDLRISSTYAADPSWLFVSAVEDASLKSFSFGYLNLHKRDRKTRNHILGTASVSVGISKILSESKWLPFTKRTAFWAAIIGSAMSKNLGIEDFQVSDRLTECLYFNNRRPKEILE